MSINKTKIPTCDVTWNPYSGCLNECPYCYAREITMRFPKNYPNGFKPTFYQERLRDPFNLKGNKIIFTCSMGDLFGVWVDHKWIDKIMWTICNCQNHQFQILTKDPRIMFEYFRYSRAIPDNLWLGATVDTAAHSDKMLYLPRKELGGIRFISFEPLLTKIPANMIDFSGIDWIWIGAQTNPLILPEKEWVDVLVDAAEDSGIRVFMKDSLKPVCGTLRKEFPRNYDIPLK